VAFFTSAVLRSESKDPSDYAVNNPNKMIRMLLGAEAGDVIRYFNKDGKREGGFSLNARNQHVQIQRNAHGYNQGYT
jgi:hypothetical protein